MGEELKELVDDLDSSPAAAPPGDALSKLQELGQRVLVIDQQIATLEERVKVREAARHDIVSRAMPEIMLQHGVDHVGVGGKTFALEDYYHASIKKDSPTREQAFAWLEAHDAGGIITYTVTTTFPKDCTEQAEELRDYVTKRYQNATVEIERGVPWKRLTSWLRELFQRRASDEPELKLPPLDIMGATVGQYVKVVEPKK